MSHECSCRSSRKEIYNQYRNDLEIVFDKNDVEKGLHYFLTYPNNEYEKRAPFILAIESCFGAALYRKKS